MGLFEVPAPLSSPKLSLIKPGFPGWEWGEERLSAATESSTRQHPTPGGDGCGV